MRRFRDIFWENWLLFCLVLAIFLTWLIAVLVVRYGEKPPPAYVPPGPKEVKIEFSKKWLEELEEATSSEEVLEEYGNPE